jgi:hypothetical protein
MINFLFGNVVTGDNHFRDGILFEDFLYGIDRSKHGITVDLLALVSKIIINETHRVQPQAKVIKKFLQGINTPPPYPKKSNFIFLAFLRKRESFGDLTKTFQDKVVEGFIILQTRFTP